MQDAILAYDRCLEIQPDSRNAGQNRLLALNYVTPGEDPLVCSEHEKWGTEFQSQYEELSEVVTGSRDPEKKLVVGYMSPDFFTHSVSYFAEAPLTHHNPERCGSAPPWNMFQPYTLHGRSPAYTNERKSASPSIKADPYEGLE